MNAHNFFKIQHDQHIYSRIKLTTAPGGGIVIIKKKNDITMIYIMQIVGPLSLLWTRRSYLDQLKARIQSSFSQFRCADRALDRRRSC